MKKVQNIWRPFWIIWATFKKFLATPLNKDSTSNKLTVSKNLKINHLTKHVKDLFIDWLNWIKLNWFIDWIIFNIMIQFHCFTQKMVLYLVIHLPKLHEDNYQNVVKNRKTCKIISVPEIIFSNYVILNKAK